MTHLLQPVKLGLRQLVGPGMVKHGLLQLGVDGFELLKCGLLGRHLV